MQNGSTWICSGSSQSLKERVQAKLVLVQLFREADKATPSRIIVRPETSDATTLVIKPGWGFRFDYRPGQYIGVGVLVDGRWRWRSYSLTSVPEVGDGTARTARTVTITVKAVPEGLLSNHLVAGVRPGTVVRLAAPRGDFVMPDPVPPRVLFVTAGSGITPVMSMVRTMQRRNQIGATTDVVHLHSAPTPDDVMFADELAGLQRSCPG